MTMSLFFNYTTVIMGSTKKTFWPFPKLLPFFFILLLLPLFLGFLLFLPSFFDQKVFPKTKVATLNLSYLTYVEVRTKLQKEIEKFLNKPFYLKAGEGQEGAFFTARQLGISVDYGKLLKQIHFVDQENLTYFWTHLFHSHEIPLEPFLKLTRADQILRTKFAVLKQGQGAKFSVNQGKELTIIPEKPICEIDYQQFLQDFTVN